MGLVVAGHRVALATGVRRSIGFGEAAGAAVEPGFAGRDELGDFRFSAAEDAIVILFW